MRKNCTAQKCLICIGFSGLLGFVIKRALSWPLVNSNLLHVGAKSQKVNTGYSEQCRWLLKWQFSLRRGISVPGSFLSVTKRAHLENLSTFLHTLRFLWICYRERAELDYLYSGFHDFSRLWKCWKVLNGNFIACGFLI